MENVIIILNYNDAQTTISLVNKIREYKNIQKIIVVDNCSTDDSYPELLKLESEKVEVLLTEKNRGYACGNNHGVFWAIDHYNPKYITIANPDVEFSDETVGNLLDYLDNNKDCGIATAKVHQGYNAWHLPGFWELLFSLFVIPRWIFKAGYRILFLQGKHTPVQCGVLEGSFFCVRADVMQAVKGYDERTFLYGEENILAKKFINAGYKSVLLPNEIYYHFHSVSVKKSISQKKQIFEYKYDSFKIYCRDYLKAGTFRMKLLGLAYHLAKVERVVYDFIMKIIRR